MNQIFKKYWYQSLTTIVIIALLTFIFTTHSSLPSHKEDKAQIDSLSKQSKESAILLKQIVDSFAVVHQKLDVAVIELTASKNQLKETETILGKKLNDYAAKIKTAKESKDTASYFAACDSLGADFSSYTIQANKIFDKDDSIINKHGREIVSLKKESDLKDKIAGEMRNGLNLSTAKYDNLYADYKLALKNGNRGKVREKVLGATAIVLAVKMIFFK